MSGTTTTMPPPGAGSPEASPTPDPGRPSGVSPEDSDTRERYGGVSRKPIRSAFVPLLAGYDTFKETFWDKLPSAGKFGAAVLLLMLPGTQMFVLAGGLAVATHRVGMFGVRSAKRTYNFFAQDAPNWAKNTVPNTYAQKKAARMAELHGTPLPTQSGPGADEAAARRQTGRGIDQDGSAVERARAQRQQDQDNIRVLGQTIKSHADRTGQTEVAADVVSGVKRFMETDPDAARDALVAEVKYLAADQPGESPDERQTRLERVRTVDGALRGAASDRGRPVFADTALKTALELQPVMRSVHRELGQRSAPSQPGVGHQTVRGDDVYNHVVHAISTMAQRPVAAVAPVPDGLAAMDSEAGTPPGQRTASTSHDAFVAMVGANRDWAADALLWYGNGLSDDAEGYEAALNLRDSLDALAASNDQGFGASASAVRDQVSTIDRAVATTERSQGRSL